MKHQDSFCQWESIISDITDMSLEFGHCNFTHIRRSANQCAHNVAKLPCELGNYIMLRNTTPPSLYNPDFFDGMNAMIYFLSKKKKPHI